MGKSQQEARRAAEGYARCQSCSYAWNFRRNHWCWRCASPLKPSPGRVQQPGGVWGAGVGGGGPK
eukprot:860701-Pyramimonas_sp.AAC.1